MGVFFYCLGFISFNILERWFSFWVVDIIIIYNKWGGDLKMFVKSIVEGVIRWKEVEMFE